VMWSSTLLHLTSSRSPKVRCVLGHGLGCCSSCSCCRGVQRAGQTAVSLACTRAVDRVVPTPTMKRYSLHVVAASGTISVACVA
jgi:hypothetical protein